MSWLAGAQDRSPTLMEGGRDPERIAILDVTDNYLSGLGARVNLGRTFGVADHAAAAERVAIVSAALWTSRWAQDPSVVGRTVELNARPYRIVGVMSPAFRDPEPIESGAVTGLWIAARDGDFKDRAGYDFRILGRLASGVSAATATAELTEAGRRLSAAWPDVNRLEGVDLGFVLHPLHETTVAAARDRLLMLLGAVVLLLMLACANVANLFLARGVSRGSELMIRSALGASRGRLAVQLFSESLITAGIAGAIGALFAAVALRAFVAAAPAGIPRLHEIRLDASVLFFVLALTVFTAVVFGMLPAMRGARTGSAAASGGHRATGTPRSHRLPSALVAVEVGISLVLVTGAALLLSSVRHLVSVPPGFDPRGVIEVDVRPPYGANTRAAVRAFYTSLVDRARALPGVSDAALIHTVPGMTGGAWGRITIDTETRPVSEPNRAFAIGDTPGSDFFRHNLIYGDAFGLLGIPLLAGRAFDDRAREGDPLVVILNERAAKRFFPGVARPLGRRLAFGPPGTDAPMREVIGIVGDIRQQGPAAVAEPQIYVPYVQRDIGRLTLLVKQRPGMTVSGETIRQMVRELASDVPVDRLQPLQSRYAETSANTRFLASLLSVFAGLGWLLAVVGTYATVSHVFARRVREMAIRFALGADAGRVFRLVVGRALRIAAIGLGAGLVVTLILARFLEGQVHGVGVRDPVTLGLAAIGIGLSVALAALAPAVRAARIDPNLVLRE
jgi:predicted permease